MAPTNSRRKPPSTKKLSAASIVGAPAQHNQPSRKGKRAWRKNVDIEDLERKLDGLREEERAFGCGFLATFFQTRIINTYRSTLQQRTDSELFIVDTKGDDKGIPLPSTLLLEPSDFFFQFEDLCHASLALPSNRIRLYLNVLLSPRFMHALEDLS
jgi:hypothetical protein